MFPSWPARSEGAKRTKKASPKAPEGGNFYKSLVSFSVDNKRWTTNVIYNKIEFK